MASSSALFDSVAPVARGGGDLELDIRQLAFTDSSGIRTFILLADQLRAGASLILANPSAAVRNTLTLVGLGRARNIEITDGKG